MDVEPDEAAAATARAQALVNAARSHPDASFAAGLAVSFATDSQDVKAWLYGDAPDRHPIEGTRALCYRSVFAGQPASQLSVVGEAKVVNAVVPSYVLGTVLATTKAHPFAAMGAVVSGLSFAEMSTRRRFAIRSDAPAFERVEVATLADGGLITHERCIVRCVTPDGAAGCLHHEVVTWHHGTVRVAGEVPPTETAALRLLQRCSRRREPCSGCAPGGEAVLQPCPHVAARARGVVFSRGWADYVDLLIGTPVSGTAHFELQQPATAAAAMARSPEVPAPPPAAADPDAVALSVGSRVSTPGASTTAANVAATATATTITQAELDAASAVLPPVRYQCEHFTLESPERFFDTTLRQAVALAEAYRPAPGAAPQGRPAVPAAVPAPAVPYAPTGVGRAGAEPRRLPPPPTGACGWAPAVTLPPADEARLALGFPTMAAEPSQAALRLGAAVASSLYPAAGPGDVGGTGVVGAAAGIGGDLAATSAAIAAEPSMEWLPGRAESELGEARQVGPESSAMRHPLEPTAFPVDTPPLFSQVTPPLFSQATPPLFPTTTRQGPAPPMQGTASSMLPQPSMVSATPTPWGIAGQWPLDTGVPPPATGAAASAAPFQPTPPDPSHGPLRGLASSPPRSRPHMCELCGSSFSSASDLSRHTSTVHERIRRWPCELCDFCGLQKGHLTTHMASVHATERRFVCDKCPPGPSAFRGVTRSAVQRHTRRVHEGSRPYACSECTSSFASTSDLTRHRRRLHGAIISTRAEALRAREEAMAAAKARREVAATAGESAAGSSSTTFGGLAATPLTVGRSSESDPSVGLSSSTLGTSSSYGAATISESTPSGAVGRRRAVAPTSTRAMPSSAVEPASWGPGAEPLLDDGGTWPPAAIPRTHQGVFRPVATAAPPADRGFTPLHDSADQVSDWQRHLHDALPRVRSFEGEQAAHAAFAMGVGGAVPGPPTLGSDLEAPGNDASTGGNPALAATAVVASQPARAASEGGTLPEADTERRNTESRVGCLPMRRVTREQDGSSSCCFWPHRYPWHR